MRKNFLSIFMLFVLSVVFAQIRIQQIYALDKQGNVQKIKKYPKKDSLIFEPDVPKLTEKQILKLIKNGKLILKEKRVEGVYDSWFLFYTPWVKTDICKLNGNIVSYQKGVLIPKDRKFSVWFLIAILGIVSMILIQIFTNVAKYTLIFAIAGAGAIVFAGVTAVIIVFSGVYARIGAVVFAFAFSSAFAAVGVDDRKLKNVFASVYYLLVLLAFLLTYLQI